MRERMHRQTDGWWGIWMKALLCFWGHSSHPVVYVGRTVVPLFYEIQMEFDYGDPQSEVCGFEEEEP